MSATAEALHAIELYFPPGQVANALCVLAAEGGDLFGFDPTRWEPHAAGDNTPFSSTEWDVRNSPETNAWMASVVWSIGGWRAWPSACSLCSICDVTGEPIPHPRNPIAPRGDVAGGSPLVAIIGTIGVILGLGGLAHLDATGRFM